MEELTKAIKHLEQAKKLIDQAEEKVWKKNPRSNAIDDFEKATMEIATQIDKICSWDYAISREQKER